VQCAQLGQLQQSLSATSSACWWRNWNERSLGLDSSSSTEPPPRLRRRYPSTQVNCIWEAAREVARAPRIVPTTRRCCRRRIETWKQHRLLTQKKILREPSSALSPRRFPRSSYSQALPLPHDWTTVNLLQKPLFVSSCARCSEWVSSNKADNKSRLRQHPRAAPEEWSRYKTDGCRTWTRVARWQAWRKLSRKPYEWVDPGLETRRHWRS
jgi:hypothetical protein